MTYVYTDEDVFTNLEPLDNRNGIIAVLGTFIVFHIINAVLSQLDVPASAKQDPWRWRNLLISWIHSGICGSWVVSCLVLYPEMVEDLISHQTYYSYYLIAFSAGYFLFDFSDMIKQNKIISLWELTLHHLAVMAMFLYNVYDCRCIAYNVVALLAEVNSFFLHSRKLLQMKGYTNRDPVYAANAFINLITFVCCRGVGLVWITVGMYLYGHRVSRAYWWTLSGSMFVMNVINPILFWRLLYNDFLRGNKRAPTVRANGDATNTLSNGFPTSSSSQVNNNIKQKGE